MDNDFDKEMDALLRSKAHRDGPVYVGDFASPHLDADEISAFAENAMPEKSRALYMAHMADCDRCRKILSNVLVMNADMAAAAAPASAITIAERSEPWYKRLFLFPNLAYVMGSLVLIFAGFLGYSIIQNSTDGGYVTQVSEGEAVRGGPNFQEEPVFSGEAPSSSNMTGNTAANTAPAVVLSNSNAAPAATPGDMQMKDAATGQNNFAIDGSAADSTAAPPPPAPMVSAAQPVAKEARERDDLAKAKTEDKVASVTVQESAKNDAMQKQFPGAGQSQSGPMRNNENRYNRQLEGLDARARAVDKKKSGTRDEDSSSGKRSISGKSFERKQGVWYDSTFQGRPTINVRRGTDEFNRLDAGLKSIANSLGGTVVIVWGAKAYRIQ
jgi:hypothetical protein